MSDIKTVRVEIEESDGTIYRLTGEAADLWQRQIDHAGSMAAVHGSQFERLPWEITKTTPAPVASVVPLSLLPSRDSPFISKLEKKTP